MHEARPQSRRRSAQALATFALVAALCGCSAGDIPFAGCDGPLGESLSGLIGGSYELTESARLSPAVRVRLTQPGFDVVAKELRSLVGLVFEQDELGRVLLPIDQLLTDDIALPTIGNEDLIALKAKLHLKSLVLTLDWDSIDIALDPESVSPARIVITIHGGRFGVAEGYIAGGANLVAGGIDVPSTDVDLACDVHNAKGEDGSYLAGADLVLAVTLDTDPAGNLLLGAEVVHFELEAPAFTVTPACETAPECQDGDKDPCLECKLLCFLDFQDGDLDELVASLEEQLRPALLGIVNELVAGLLDSQLNGKPLVVAGRLSLRDLVLELAGDLASALVAVRDLGFAIAPAPGAFAVVQDGLNVTLAGGIEAAEAHPCAAAMGPPPDFGANDQGPPPDFSGITTGLDGAQLTYHIGAAVPATLLNEAMWSLASAGVLCVSVSSETIASLLGLTVTTGTADPLLPGLRSLGGGDAPLLLAIEPHLTAASFPVVTLGDESLVDLALPGAGISLYAWMADRWVRLFEIDADVAARLSAEVTAPNVISATLDHVAVERVVERYNELMPGAALDRIVPFAVELAMALLLGQPLSLEADLGPVLDSALDLPLGATVEKLGRDGGSPAKDWVALYLTVHPKAASALTAEVGTEAALDPRGPSNGRVALLITTDAQAATEAQWRVDGTLWRPFLTGSRLVVDHPMLSIAGRHTIEVRGRYRGAWRTLDPTPARVEVLVDADGRAALPPAPSAEPPGPAIDDGCAARAGRTAGGFLPVALVVALLALTRRRRQGTTK